MITYRQIAQTFFTIAGIIHLCAGNVQVGALLWIVACLLDIADEISKINKKVR